MWPFKKKEVGYVSSGDETDAQNAPAQPPSMPPPVYLQRSPTAVPHVADVHSMDIVSSALIGSGAKRTERVKIFVRPQGHELPRLGSVPDTLFSVYTPFTTNLLQSGQLGKGIGDAAIKRVRADIAGGNLETIQKVLDNVLFRFKVCAKIQLECGLRDLPHVFNPKCLLAYNDSIEGELEVTEYLEGIDPVLVRIVMPARVKRDLW